MKNYSVQTTVNFFYFLNNYSADFIEEVWKEQPNLVYHFKNKFDGNILRFIAGMTEGNRKKLISWVEDNYTHSKEYGSIRFKHKIKEIMLDSYEISEELLENNVTEDFIEQLDINVIKADEITAYFDNHEIEGFEIDKIKLLNEFKAYKRTL